MAFSHKDRVKQAVTTGGTGNLVIGAASTGYQALAAGDDGLLFVYLIEDGNAWETGYGTYTHGTLTFARTLRKDSSSGAALNVSTSALLSVAWDAFMGSYADITMQAVTPGGRLTLTTAVPVTTADVTAATNVFYTPYTSNALMLWDGSRWVPTVFSQLTLALGTTTSGKPHDVFCFLTAGAATLEKLIWTNDTTRATDISLQDGRYCKTGDKTRLYLGTFYTTSTTATEDSKAKRFLWNMYNRRLRTMEVLEATASWAYSTATPRQANASTANQLDYVCGLAEDNVSANITINQVNNSTATARLVFAAVGVDQLAAGSGGTEFGNCTSAVPANPAARYIGIPGVGRHYLAWLEVGGGTDTQTWSSGNLSGIQGSVLG
jgi:hypothetical protein